MSRKPLSSPSWAKEKDIVGYTSTERITHDNTKDMLQQLIDEAAGSRSELPSIYYRHGHATLDHGHGWNVGWEDLSGCEYLFFGNAPRGSSEKVRLAQRRGEKELKKCVRELKAGEEEALLEVWRDRDGNLYWHESRNKLRKDCRR